MHHRNELLNAKQLKLCSFTGDGVAAISKRQTEETAGEPKTEDQERRVDAKKRETFLQSINPLGQLFKEERVNWIKTACENEALRQGNWSLVSCPVKLCSWDFIPGLLHLIRESESERMKFTKILLECPDHIANLIHWETIWKLWEMIRLKEPDSK